VYDDKLAALECEWKADDECAKDVRISRGILVRHEVPPRAVDVERMKYRDRRLGVVRAQRCSNVAEDVAERFIETFDAERTVASIELTPVAHTRVGTSFRAYSERCRRTPTREFVADAIEEDRAALHYLDSLCIGAAKYERSRDDRRATAGELAFKCLGSLGEGSKPPRCLGVVRCWASTHRSFSICGGRPLARSRERGRF
jgi:hypothetical protein